MPSVCNAIVTLPRKKKGRDAEGWDQFWRSRVRECAGAWARVTVVLQRYSFDADDRQGRQSRRIGTRLRMKNIEPFAPAIEARPL